MAYSIERMPERISIGRETETGVTDVMIDCGAWVMKWPGMALHAIYTPEGGAPYILQTETDGGVLVWHVTDADTATPGTGLMEIVGETDGRRKVSAMVKVFVASRMGGTVGDPPEAAKPWVESVIGAADRITGMQVQAETLDAGSGATAAWDGVQGLLTIGVPKGEKGEKGDTGAQGPQGVPGADGKDAVVDATLTQSGQAADAKVTGDTFGQLKGDIVLLKNDVAQMADTWELIENFTVEEEAVIQRNYAGQYRKILVIARQDTDKVPKFRMMSDSIYWEFYGFSHYQHAILYLMGEIVIPGIFSDVRTIAGAQGGNASVYYPITVRLTNTVSYFNGLKSDDVCKVGTTINVYGVSV